MDGDSSVVLYDTLLINNHALYGGAAWGLSMAFKNCTMKRNTASSSYGSGAGSGGALYGSGDLEDCVLIGNFAGYDGGAAYVSVASSITRCVIAEGGAWSKGAAIYSEGAVVQMRDSIVRGFAANASSDTTTLVYLATPASTEMSFDRVTWLDNDLDAAATNSDGNALIVVRNCDGLVAADVAGAAPLVGCGDATATQYCQADYCNDTATGIDCYCDPDGVKTDPDLGACQSSGQMANLVLGSEKSQSLLLKKDNGIATTNLFWSNTGEVFIVWGLAFTNNTEGLNWTASSTNGMLEAGGVQQVVLSLAMNGMQARAAEYITELTLNTSSPTPTPFPIFSFTTVVVRVVLSALASAVASFVNTTNLGRLAAGDSMAFTVTPVDATGTVILDPIEFAYFGTLTHPASNTSVACRMGYNSISNLQEGACELPATVCTVDDASSDECVLSPPVGEFSLEVNDAKGMVVGARRYPIIVESCPETFYQRDGKCMQCPPRVECSAGSSISEWKLDEGFWRSGDESEDVRECRFGALSCPGVDLNQGTGQDPYCGLGFVGPLCSQCAANYFLSWAGKGDCHSCAAGQSHWPTIGLVSGVVVLGGAVVARTAHKSSTKSTPAVETSAPPSMFAKLEQLFLLAKVKIFTLFLVSQVLTMWSFVVSSIHSVTLYSLSAGYFAIRNDLPEHRRGLLSGAGRNFCASAWRDEF